MAQNKEIKRSFYRFAIIASAAALLFLCVKRDSIFRWIQSGFILRSQEKQIEFYEKDNARLEREIERLSNDRDSLEKFAREEFGFAEPGDDVYVEE